MKIGRLCFGNRTAWINAVVQLNGLSGPDQLSVSQMLNLPGTTGSTTNTITPTTSSSSTASTGGTSTVNVNNTNSAATCQSSTLPTCDYASNLASRHRPLQAKSQEVETNRDE